MELGKNESPSITAIGVASCAPGQLPAVEWAAGGLCAQLARWGTGQFDLAWLERGIWRQLVTKHSSEPSINSTRPHGSNRIGTRDGVPLTGNPLGDASSLSHFLFTLPYKRLPDTLLPSFSTQHTKFSTQIGQLLPHRSSSAHSDLKIAACPNHGQLDPFHSQEEARRAAQQLRP